MKPKTFWMMMFALYAGSDALGAISEHTSGQCQVTPGWAAWTLGILMVPIFLGTFINVHKDMKKEENK